MPIGDRIKRLFHDDEDDGRRLVRSGDTFTSDELERDEIRLERPEPGREPDDPKDAAEPWGADDPRFAERLRLYRQFLERWEEEH